MGVDTVVLRWVKLTSLQLKFIARLHRIRLVNSQDDFGRLDPVPAPAPDRRLGSAGQRDRQGSVPRRGVASGRQGSR